MNPHPIRVLFLTKYTRIGASSRYRSFQYLPFLAKFSIESEFSPLFDDNYLASRYGYGVDSKINLLRAFLRRVRALLKVKSFDLLVIEYEVLPYFPAIFERVLKWLGIRFVLDYDDALFHQYDRHRNPLLRKLLGEKIATVMRLADAVVVGNSYLSEYARQAGSKQVEIIPTVIDLDRYPAPEIPLITSNIFTIGWIGSPSTSIYLHSIAHALAAVCQSKRVRVRLIGSGAIELPGVDLEVLPWNEEKEVELIRSFDVGIMPLPDEPWTRGKCGFKLIQYMGCGLPVIAASIGANNKIVEHGVNGFLASTQEDWQQAIEMLMVDSKLGKTMGLAGRRKVEEQYCLQVTAPRFISLLQSLAVKG